MTNSVIWLNSVFFFFPIYSSFHKWPVLQYFVTFLINTENYLTAGVGETKEGGYVDLQTINTLQQYKKLTTKRLHTKNIKYQNNHFNASLMGCILNKNTSLLYVDISFLQLTIYLCFHFQVSFRLLPRRNTFALSNKR